MRAKLSAVAIAAVLVSTLPAGAEELPAEGVALDTFFHCTGDSKVLNALTVQEAPSWDENAPTQSVTEGAGCGFADPGSRTGTNQENVYDAVFKGYHTGNLDSLTVRLHDIGLGPARTGAEQTLGVRVSVEGVSMFDTILPAASPLDLVLGDPVPVPATTQITVKPVASETGASQLVEFTITGLGFMEQPGAGTFDREILVTVNSISEHASAWVMDTTEVPSGITFNPETPAAAAVAATTPGAYPAQPAPEPTEAPTEPTP